MKQPRRKDSNRVCCLVLKCCLDAGPTAHFCQRALLLDAPANAAWPTSGCDNVAVGSVCNATCVAGFIGTGISVCNSNGVWDTAVGTCRATSGE